MRIFSSKCTHEESSCVKTGHTRSYYDSLLICLSWTNTFFSLEPLATEDWVILIYCTCTSLWLSNKKLILLCSLRTWRWLRMPQYVIHGWSIDTLKDMHITAFVHRSPKVMHPRLLFVWLLYWFASAATSRGHVRNTGAGLWIRLHQLAAKWTIWLEIDRSRVTSYTDSVRPIDNRKNYPAFDHFSLGYKWCWEPIPSLVPSETDQ